MIKKHTNLNVHFQLTKGVAIMFEMCYYTGVVLDTT